MTVVVRTDAVDGALVAAPRSRYGILPDTRLHPIPDGFPARFGFLSPPEFTATSSSGELFA